MSEIDWSIFDKYPEDTCDCRCGKVFRTHSKFVAELSRVITRKPCPDCGKNDNFRKISSDPEKWTLKNETGKGGLRDEFFS